jgi:hypothetical protein
MMKKYDVLDTQADHVVIEVFGGDNNLNDFVMEDMREMMAGNTGSDAKVVVLALADFATDGASVVELSPRTGNRVVEPEGEINTGDPDTLIEFFSRAINSYPNAQRRAIGFWDHGSGVFDEFDPQVRSATRALARPARSARGRSRAARKLFVKRSSVNEPKIRAMLHDDTNGGLLTNKEAGRVLAETFQLTDGVSRVDMIFSDTCLNGMIEVLAELGPYADFVVGSEDLEPGDGWDYALWFQRITTQRPADTAAWARSAVEAFGDSYRDRTTLHPVTLGAYRTQTKLLGAVADLVRALVDTGENGFVPVDRARGKAQAFARRDTYDLADFTTHLAGFADDARVKQSCKSVQSSLEEARVAAVKHGDQVANAQGLAIWIPSTRYALTEVKETYQELAFEKQTGWLQYLEKYR